MHPRTFVNFADISVAQSTPVWRTVMLRASIIVTVLSLGASAISFVNQVVIAALFGASVHIDAYLIATSVPMLFSGTLSAMLGYALVPVLITHKQDDVTYSRFSSIMLLCISCCAIVISIVGYVTAPDLVDILSPALLTDAVPMTRISWLTSVFLIMAGCLTAMHQAEQHFYRPVFASMFPYAAVLIFGATVGRAWGPLALTWGMLVGSLLAVFLLLMRSKLSLSIWRGTATLWKEVGRFFLQMPLVLLAMLCFTVYQFIDAYWAPKLGAGNLAYLGYCQRVLVALGTLIVAGPSAVMLPRLANHFNEKRSKEFLDDTGRAVRTVLALASAIAVMFSILAVPAVELLFQRGEFNQQATYGVVSILPFMLVGMVAMLGVVILFRALFAQRNVVSTALVGGLCVSLYFVLSGELSGVFLLRGIGLAYAISWWTALGVTIAILWKGSLSELLVLGNFRFAWHLILSLAFTSVVVMLAANIVIVHLSDVGYIQLALRMAITLSLGLVAFYVSSVRIFRMPDVKLIFDFFEKPLLRLLSGLH